MDEEEDDVRLNVGEDLGASSGRVVGILKRRRSSLWLLRGEWPVPAAGPALPRVIVEKRVKDTDKRVVVRIDGWALVRVPARSFRGRARRTRRRRRKPRGVFAGLGVAAGPFSARALACLPPPDLTSRRMPSVLEEDLRASVICSIDPPRCRDIDDALSCTFDEGVYRSESTSPT